MRSLAGLVVLAATLGLPTSLPALDRGLYAELLRQHTEETNDLAGTRVDYAALQESADWRRLVASLEATDPETLSTRAERLAFWVNAYNILAIDVVVEHYPVEGIREIGGWITPVWDLEVTRIGGEPVSLGRIEHEILRPMGEPRIHGTIVCASLSCPALRREPFDPERLEAQLDASMERFLASRRKGLRIEETAKVVHLSKIFDWFEEDFERAGGPLAFAQRFVEGERRAWLEAHAGEAELRYFDYDWSLNALERRAPSP